MSKEKGYLSRDSRYVWLPGRLRDWGWNELSDVEAEKLRHEAWKPVIAVLKKKPSRQSILFLKWLAEGACRSLAYHISESEDDFSLPSFEEKVPGSFEEPTWYEKQYVNWEACVEILKCNQKAQRALLLGEYPSSGKGRKIDDLYINIVSAIRSLEDLQANPEVQNWLRLVFGEDLCNEALALPPLSSDSISSWVDVINQMILVRHYQLDLSNYRRNITRLEDQIKAAKKEIGNDAAGIKETELLALEKQLKKKRKAPSLNELRQGRISAIRKRLKSIVLAMEEKKAELD